MAEEESLGRFSKSRLCSSAGIILVGMQREFLLEKSL
jgi:hypothetical protein